MINVHHPISLSHLCNAPLKFYQTKQNIDIKISQLISPTGMTVQVSSMRLSYFSCLPNGTQAHSCPFLGRELTIPAFTNLLKQIHTFHSQSYMHSTIFCFHNAYAYIYIYIYNQKRKERAARVFFSLFVLFHSRTHTTTMVFMFLASFTSP